MLATSDNVVRDGLTPKYRDVETLCSMLTYKQVCPIKDNFPFLCEQFIIPSQERSMPFLFVDFFRACQKFWKEYPWMNLRQGTHHPSMNLKLIVASFPLVEL